MLKNDDQELYVRTKDSHMNICTENHKKEPNVLKKMNTVHHQQFKITEAGPFKKLKNTRRNKRK